MAKNEEHYFACGKSQHGFNSSCLNPFLFQLISAGYPKNMISGTRPVTNLSILLRKVHSTTVQGIAVNVCKIFMRQATAPPTNCDVWLHLTQKSPHIN